MTYRAFQNRGKKFYGKKFLGERFFKVSISDIHFQSKIRPRSMETSVSFSIDRFSRLATKLVFHE